MRANCVICSDLFDEINQISVTPCGHVYHSSCIMLWIDQSKTCPQCRIRIAYKDIQKLYFNFPPKHDFNSSELENEVANLKAELSAKDVELVACKKEREDTVAFVRVAEKKASDLQQKVYKFMSENSELHLRVKSTSKLEAKVLKLEQLNMALTNDLQNLNNVLTIINGTQKDVEDILKEYSDCSASAKQLATYCTCLKRELQKVIESKNKLVELNSKLKRENGQFAAKIKFFEEAMAISNRDKSLDKTPTPLKKSICISNENASFFANTPSTSSQNTSCEEVDVSPLAVPFNKTKFNMCIKTSSSTTYKSEPNGQSDIKHSTMASIAIRKQNNNGSVVRTGYNGLGGHSNFIVTSGIKRKNPKKK